MDPAFLRRIKYKIRLDPPTVEDYTLIFERMCHFYDLDFPEEIIPYLIDDFYKTKGVPVSSSHPKIIVEHVMAASKYRGIQPRVSMELLNEALESLIVTGF
jgi:hypothetical protein